jgi:hypothetical protein
MEMICASVARPAMIHMIYDMMAEKPHARPFTLGNQPVHQSVAKTGARGNYVAFMMPLQKLAHELQRSKHARKHSEHACLLPRTGPDLVDAVVVTLKCMDESNKHMHRVLQQCTIRRAVVIQLIQTLHDNKHPYYKDLDMTLVRERAKQHLVPGAADYEARIPEEVLSVVLDEEPEIDQGKAAVPSFGLNTDNEDCMQSASRAGVFDASLNNADENIRTATAYTSLYDQLKDQVNSRQETNARDEAWDLLTGSAMSQFDASFFATAFCFLFPYGIGGPDMPNGLRERAKGSPDVALEQCWSKLIAQRVENQFRTDPTFLFAVWNLVFRQIVNLGSNMCAVESSTWDDSVTAHDFKQAAVNIMQGLHENYDATDGKRMCHEFVQANNDCMLGTMNLIHYVL